MAPFDATEQLSGSHGACVTVAPLDASDPGFTNGDVAEKSFFFLGLGSGMFVGWFAQVLVCTL